MTVLLFLLQSVQPGILKFGAGCPWGFGFQALSREEEEAEAKDLGFVIDLTS